MHNESTNLSARLLATENISVVRASTITASFDIKSRVLTLPMWKDMTPEIEDMLVGHEVGHALYTGEKYMDPIIENPRMKSYLNVLEDVRIEKLIKRKYPGLRKRMSDGYKQLNERDFFGVKKVASMEALILIDKINLYYKAGYACGVTFSPEEKMFVVRAERTETIEDVIQLAKEVYEFSKQQIEERKKQQIEAGDFEEDDDDDGEDYDFDLDPEAFEDMTEEEIQDLKDQKTFKNPRPSPTAEATDQDLESVTEKTFQQQLEDLADTSTEYHYYKLDSEYKKDTVIGYRRILTETVATWGDSEKFKYDDWQRENQTDLDKKNFDSFESFKTESLRTVNYLVKEFEMKKSATMYKRAQTSKIGSLDMRIVWSFQLNDDLFKRVTTIPQGKNHGMVFLLDWSGSMHHVIQDTLKQVINLVMFCQRVQIPFRVFAFTSDYRDNSYDWREVNRLNAERAAKGDLLNNATSRFNLLELFSSKMTTTEFYPMARRVIDQRFLWNDGYGMGGTPVNESLSWVYHNLGEYIKQNNVEKLSLITLTDGEGSRLHPIGSQQLRETTYKSVDGQYKHVKQKHFIREENTKKTYELTDKSGQQTEILLRMIKDRYNVSLVGFYISRNHRRDLESVLNAHYPFFNAGKDAVIEEWRKAFRNNGFASLQNTGRDELFLIPQTATKIEEGELEVKADAKAASIARSFSKYLNVKKTSRILLNRFVQLVA